MLLVPNHIRIDSKKLPEQPIPTILRNSEIFSGFLGSSLSILESYQMYSLRKNVWVLLRSRNFVTWTQISLPSASSSRPYWSMRLIKCSIMLSPDFPRIFCSISRTREKVMRTTGCSSQHRSNIACKGSGHAEIGTTGRWGGLAPLLTWITEETVEAQNMSDKEFWPKPRCLRVPFLHKNIRQIVNKSFCVIKRFARLILVPWVTYLQDQIFGVDQIVWSLTLNRAFVRGSTQNELLQDYSKAINVSCNRNFQWLKTDN